jgi:hypothetical protein
MAKRALLPLLLTVITFLLFGGSASAAKLDAPWIGTGSGTIKVVGDGGAADPQLDHQVNATSGAWTFSARAATARTLTLAYESSGAWTSFQLRAKLVSFASRGGVDIGTATLYDTGSATCCLAPFTYKGQVAFALQPGDVYGFRISSSAVDSIYPLAGTFKLQELDSTPPSVTPVVTGTKLAGDVYVGPVTVKWTVADPDSRILTGCTDATVADTGADRTLTCTATSRGGSTTKTVTIKRDRDAPTLTVPPAVVKQAPGATGGAPVSYEATATDTLDPAPAVSCSPASGTELPIGTTTVTCTAADKAGNVTSKSFEAIVVPGAAAQPSVIVNTVQVPAAPGAPKAIDAVLAFRFTIARSTTRLIALTVKNLPKGAKVAVTCKGGSCPKKLRGSGSVLTSKGAALNLSALVKANLKSGTTINVAISASGALTTIKSLAVRKGKAPVVRSCTASGAQPVAC